MFSSQELSFFCFFLLHLWKAAVAASQVACDDRSPKELALSYAWCLKRSPQSIPSVCLAVFARCFKTSLLKQLILGDGEAGLHNNLVLLILLVKIVALDLSPLQVVFCE